MRALITAAAVFAGWPEIRERLALGQQFNAYDLVGPDDDEDDDDLDKLVCLGPITNALSIIATPNAAVANLIVDALNHAAQLPPRMIIAEDGTITQLDGAQHDGVPASIVDERIGIHAAARKISLADVFDNQAPQAWRDDLWALIEATPHLTWLLLTKRPQNIVGMVPPNWLIIPPANVWYGATIENRATLAQRHHHLAAVPAARRFWSCEPLLEDLGDVTPMLVDLGLVIAGGESGPRARPSHPDWFRHLRDQCAATGTVFHFKQWGEWLPCERGNPLGGVDLLARDGFIAQRVGKAKAGRTLDGVIHDAMPGEQAHG